MLIHFMRCHFVPFGSSVSSALPMPMRLPRPTVNSHTIMGRPSATRNTRYIRMNAAPPYMPVMYGNFHTLPIPMAHPAETKINPNREPNFSLSFIRTSPHTNNDILSHTFTFFNTNLSLFLQIAVRHKNILIILLCLTIYYYSNLEASSASAMAYSTTSAMGRRTTASTTRR